MSEPRLIRKGMTLRGALTEGGPAYLWNVRRVRPTRAGATVELVTVTDGVGGSDLTMEATVSFPGGTIAALTRDWEIVDV